MAYVMLCLERWTMQRNGCLIAIFLNYWNIYCWDSHLRLLVTTIWRWVFWKHQKHAYHWAHATKLHALALSMYIHVVVWHVSGCSKRRGTPPNTVSSSIPPTLVVLGQRIRAVSPATSPTGLPLSLPLVAFPPIYVCAFSVCLYNYNYNNSLHNDIKCY